MRSLAASRCRSCAAAAAARLVSPAAPTRAATAGGGGGTSSSRAAATKTAVAAARAPRRSSSSSPPTGDPASPAPPPPPPSPAARGLRRARALLEQRAPPESFSIRGVTFDGRQELVARLGAGEPVRLSREPWNAFDPSAVRICTLRGEHLGYVDRRCTGAFATREVAYGFVDSVGRAPAERGGPVEEGAAGGPWGARVVVWPFLAALVPEVLPAAMAAEADARLGLRFPWEQQQEEEKEGRGAPRPPPARWRRLAAAAFARARGVCEATGVTAAPAAGAPMGGGAPSLYGPLVALPEWRWDEAARRVVLAGAACVCSPVARCVRAARLPPSRRAERAAALGLAMDLMRWDVGNMREYLLWQERRALEVEREGGWTLDLGGGEDEEEERGGG